MTAAMHVFANGAAPCRRAGRCGGRGPVRGHRCARSEPASPSPAARRRRPSSRPFPATRSDWSKVTVTLVDERFVEPDSDRSNEKLVRENLLVEQPRRRSLCRSTILRRPPKKRPRLPRSKWPVSAVPSMSSFSAWVAMATPRPSFPAVRALQRRSTPPRRAAS